MDAEKVTLAVIQNKMANAMSSIEDIVKVPVISYDGTVTYGIDATFLRCLELVKNRDKKMALLRFYCVLPADLPKVQKSLSMPSVIILMM